MASKRALARQNGRNKTTPALRLEVSIPETKTVIEAFAEDRLAALEAFTLGVRAVAASALNQLLHAEMELFLGQPDQSDNKRNGFITREYGIKGFGRLSLRVPRDRVGAFSSAIVPAHERMDPRLRKDLALLHLAGISSRTLATISKTILGLDVSRDTVLSSLEGLQEAADKWLTRELSSPYWALFVDATNFKMQRRGSTELEPTLVVIGVDEANHRSLLAIEPGGREDVAAWRAVFRDLKRRGLDAKAVRVGVMDGLPGLENLFRQEFPNAVTARCWLHALKNALAKTPTRLREPFKQLTHKVMYATSEDDARKAFSKLKAGMNGDAQGAVVCLEKDLDALVAHYRFERRFWLPLKTTNAVERVHREMKRRTKAMGALGEGSLRVLVAFTALRLEAGWRRQRIDSRAIYNFAHVDRTAIESAGATKEAMDTLTGSE